MLFVSGPFRTGYLTLGESFSAFHAVLRRKVFLCSFVFLALEEHLKMSSIVFLYNVWIRSSH